MAARQQVPISMKTVYPNSIVGTTVENGDNSLVFIDQLGRAHVFPITEDDQSTIVKALTGGIEIPRVELPPGARA